MVTASCDQESFDQFHLLFLNEIPMWVMCVYVCVCVLVSGAGLAGHGSFIDACCDVACF